MVWVFIFSIVALMIFFVSSAKSRSGFEPATAMQLTERAVQSLEPENAFRRQAEAEQAALEPPPVAVPYYGAESYRYFPKLSDIDIQGNSDGYDINLSLPEVGDPGTATKAQVAAVEKVFGHAFPDSESLSFEQASMILCSREYARAMADVFDREGRPLDEEISTPLIVAFILSDDTLRSYVSKWGRNRFARGTHHEPPKLRRNEHFDKVYRFVSSKL